MKKIILILMITMVVAIGIAAQEVDAAYYVAPVGKSGASAANRKDFAKVKIFPMVQANLAKKILFYIEPMEGKIRSLTPKKDAMGMDFPAVYVDDSDKKVLFYVNPMDKTIISPTPVKDEMGMDYLPVYEMKVFTK